MAKALVDRLLQSEHPSIRYKTRVNVLGESVTSRSVRALRAEIKDAAVTRQLLAGRGDDGRIAPTDRIYAKWQGAHWVAAALADLGYPPGDKALIALRDQLLDQWLGETFYLEFEADTKAKAYRGRGVPVAPAASRRGALTPNFRRMPTQIIVKCCPPPASVR